MKKLFFLITNIAVIALFRIQLYARPVCKTESFSRLSNVAISAVTLETTPTPYCKAAGVI